MFANPVDAPARREDLYLWYAYPDDLLTEGAVEVCASLMSDEERTRWQSFHFDRNRREYLATRVLARTALSHMLPHPPASWRFSRNQYGKPVVDPECGLSFSLSNSLGLVACLVGEGSEIGLDVEAHERDEQIAALAPEVFSPLELAQLDALHGPDRLDRALSLWTLKEAYIKARGMGLSLPLRQFSFVFGGVEGVRLELDPCLGDQAERWRFCLLEHAGHRIALMTAKTGQTTTPALQLWQARPLLSTPTRLAPGRQPWFPSLPGSCSSLRQQ
jgi:4'-phosphopantetheinyl transferase